MNKGRKESRDVVIKGRYDEGRKNIGANAVYVQCTSRKFMGYHCPPAIGQVD
jgi:hypothetical protein